jgi:hypothetical protein
LVGWRITNWKFMKGNPKELAQLPMVWVIGGHEHKLGCKLSQMPPREQVNQAMRGL